MKYSRSTPSTEYKELINLYEEMHRNPTIVFEGGSLKPYIKSIRKLLARTGAKTLLDYGAGKGFYYEKKEFGLRKNQDLKTYWGLEELALYDPAYPPFSHFPEKKFDAIICIDVLEHCPESDLSWIIDEIFSHAAKCVYFAIACHKALKMLPNRRNCHITVRPPAWWKLLIEPEAAKYQVECIVNYTCVTEKIEN